MKTAMQYLKDDILIEKQLGLITENASKRIIDYIDNLYLEKEKEQIMKAFLEGKVNHSKDWSIEYYNQTYNQNK